MREVKMYWKFKKKIYHDYFFTIICWRGDILIFFITIIDLSLIQSFYFQVWVNHGPFACQRRPQSNHVIFFNCHIFCTQITYQLTFIAYITSSIFLLHLKWEPHKRGLYLKIFFTSSIATNRTFVRVFTNGCPMYLDKCLR